MLVGPDLLHESNGADGGRRGSGGWFYTGGLSGTATSIPNPAADSYSPGGYTVNSGHGIDNAGEVFGGAYFGSDGWQMPYVYTGGTSYSLAASLDPQYLQYGGVVTAVSPNGAYAVGNWMYGNPPGVPVYQAGYWTPKTVAGQTSWANGATFTDLSSALSGLGYFGSSVSVAANNAGQIVCGTTSGNGGIKGITSPFIYQAGAGTFTSLGSLRFSYPKAATLIDGSAGFQNCINGSGQVVGYEVVGGVNHAAIWQNGTITDLQTVCRYSAERFRAQQRHGHQR